MLYAVFPTRWGYFGLAGTENVLCRTQLPLPDADRATALLLGALAGPAADGARRQKVLFADLQRQIAAYFEDDCPEFDGVELDLESLAGFTRKVLQRCRQIQYGQVITYGELADRLGNPQAARAVGNALSRNPLPLIIPCHRVIRHNGQLGGFTAPGGVTMKSRLLAFEQHGPQQREIGRCKLTACAGAYMMNPLSRAT